MCEGGCFTLLSIEVAHDSGEQGHIDINSSAFTQARHYYVKDKFSLSDSAYREISQLTLSIPRLHKLKALASSLNSEYEIFPAPYGVMGVQQRLAPRLLVQLKSLTSLKNDDVLQIKLTGNGANIGRSVHIVNVAFTLLNDASSVSSPNGNHSLAIFQTPENYESLQEALADVIKEMKKSYKCEVKSRHCSLCGDSTHNKRKCPTCPME